MFRYLVGWLLLGVALADVGRPKLSFGINSAPDHPGTLGTIEPRLVWTAEGRYEGIEYEGGVDLTVHDAEEIPPVQLWAKAKKVIGRGWSLAGRVDTVSEHMARLDVELTASDDTTAVQIKGTFQGDAKDLKQIATLNAVKLSQQWTAMGGKWTVIPRFHVPQRKADVTVAYGIADTVIAIDASSDSTKLSVSQQINAENQLTPSVTTSGEAELEYRRAVGHGYVTTTLKPNESLNVRWEDGVWNVDIKAPMEGIFFRDGVKVKVRRVMDA